MLFEGKYIDLQKWKKQGQFQLQIYYINYYLQSVRPISYLNSS